MEDTNEDQVDSTLPPEWTLPDLPKNLTPSLSTVEFEEIFGGSDDEGNFPLSVGGLKGHLELDNVLPNPSELFNTSMPEPLNIDSKELDDKIEMSTNNNTTLEKPTTSSERGEEGAIDAPVKTDKDQEEMEVEVDTSTETLTTTTNTSTQSDTTCGEEKQEEEIRDTTTSMNEDQSTTDDGQTTTTGTGTDTTGTTGTDTATGASTDTTSVTDTAGTSADNVIDATGTSTDTVTDTTGSGRRSSARIKARVEQNFMVAENVTIKSDGDEEVYDEENLVDSLLEKNDEIFEQKEEDTEDPSSSGGLVVDAPPIQHDDDDDNSSVMYSGDEDSDDPDKLWCICQQPHNDRFMICCDSCGEWYHGDCIGISVAEGKRMEKTGQEYVCTKCIEREHTSKAEREKNRSVRLARREQMREKQIAELHGKKQSDSSDPAEGGGDNDLFLPDNLTEKDQINLKQQKKKLRIRDLVRKPCLGPGCEKMAVRPCLYCSEECIEKHCEFSLKKLSVRGLLPNTGQGITLYEPSTKKMLTGISAPPEKDLLQFIKEHRSYKVFVPSQKVVSAAKKPMKKSRKESDKDDQVPDSTNKLNLDASAIRVHAKKALKQVLMARCQNTADIEKSEEEVTDLANDIELKLYNLYNQDVTQKYKSKCRSLLFNLKDTKNQVLFKKIVTGELGTRQLVRMTPDQLASEELAEWREKTIKKELEMIKEVAIEEAQMSSSGVIRKMTYKGEVEIERQTEIEVVQPDEVTSTTPELPTPVAAASPPSKATPTIVKVKTEIKSSGNESKDSLLSDLLTDTTSQHGLHIFDHNCDICLGKKSSLSGHQLTSDNNSDVPSPDSRTMDSELSVTEVPSPDPIDTYSDPLPAILSPITPLWSGTVSMHGLETTTVMAYPVSGQIDRSHIADSFPDSLLIVGRIAHAQVWDYIDKLRGSLTKEIAVLRFERIESDRNSYLDLMDYLISKHRYGVLQCTGIYGVKDMYLVPLQYDDPPPPYLYPFNGPGLPVNRKDTFLCIITKIKQHQSTAAETPRKRKHSSRVHFSSDVETPSAEIPTKKSRMQVTVGFGNTTPPLLTDDNAQEQVSTSPLTQEPLPPPPPLSVPSKTQHDDTKHKPFFYRETEFKEPIVKKEPSEESKPARTPGTGSGQKMAASSNNPSTGNVKSILSTLSEEKIKELASAAMSSITTHPASMTTPPSTIKDIKKEISIPAESTSLMKGNLSNYSISTAELVREDESSRPRTLSLDERLQATFGGGGARPGGPREAQPHPYSHPHSNYPHSDYNSSYNSAPPHDPNYGYQQRQGGPPHVPTRGGGSGPHHSHPPDPQSDYNLYHSSPHSGSSFRSPHQQQPPHPPDRYHDYRSSPSGGSNNYNSPHRYEYNRDDDYYRNRGEKGDYGDRRGRDDYRSNRGAGQQWRNHSDSYRRDREGGVAGGDHRTMRRGGSWSDNRTRNDDYGRS